MTPTPTVEDLDRLDAEEKKYGVWKGDLTEALTMTGCRDLADLIDMANVGNGLMERIDQLTKCEGPFKNWTPADDPCEIVFDLVNAMDEAQDRATTAEARCRALNEALTPSADTKATYIGEVKFAVSTGFDEDGSEIWQDITVPWTTTKTIMAMILGHAAMLETGRTRPSGGDADGEQGR